MTADIEDTTILRIMPREMRLMSERIFSLTALPPGFAVTLNDMVMYSEKTGLGGFAALERLFDTLCKADPKRLRITAEAGPDLTLDAGGEHAWIAVQSVVDLAGELVARHGRARITVENVSEPAELALAGAFAGRSGLKAEVAGNTVTAVAGPVCDPVLDAALTEGTPIPADLWWRIYARARTALAPDTVVSRRHAGVVIVTDDGTVIGRKDNDDDTDVSFLTRPGEDRAKQEAGA